MKRWIGWGMAAAAAMSLGAAPASAEGKKSKLTLEAERAGWMLGMFVGEQKTQPYPFVVQVDPKGEAKLRGIRPGDELMRFQEEPIQSLPRLFDQVNRLGRGKLVTFWIRRGVQTLKFELRVPKDPGAKPGEETEKSAKDAREDEKGEKTGESADGKEDEKKTAKKKKPVVIKPIPSDQP